ncbi:FAD-dependent oxidoreductase [Flavobacterium sp.]|uniref:glycerol-3-phosphate dehydrogenase/oxidase n=1 Tax=Flavobacterium sp. TaxID=239 RepID=UPI003D14925E
MDRLTQIEKLKFDTHFDCIIIGGGATGLGCAIDAASRGYKTLLLEKYDFAKGTSSRATKLVHGGVRYLAQGNIRLVREALFERGRLLRNAPHVCQKLPFVMPAYHWYDKWYYGMGLWVYEFLSSKLSLGKTDFLSKTETLALLPSIKAKGLSGGIKYFDGQFDDSRLAINLAQTAVEQGAIVINYFGVTDFIKQDNQIIGVVATDIFTNESIRCTAKTVINATGVFADSLLVLAEKEHVKTIAPSQGIHLVVDQHFFEGKTALMMPKTEDGRVFFVIPWHNKWILGTTDTPVSEVHVEPRPLEEEIVFILHHFNMYTAKKLERSDVKSVFVGLRPLVKVENESSTAVMPRDHAVKVLESGLIHIIGGKWTTYRSMAQHAIDVAIEHAGLNFVKCKTKRLPIHGCTPVVSDGHLAVYGSDKVAIEQLMQRQPELSLKIHPDYPYTKAEVVWFIQNEMAQTLEDVLARRIRLLFLDAQAAIEAAEIVAELFVIEMKKSQFWKETQLTEFKKLALQYLIN